jgi:hypothetical protein
MQDGVLRQIVGNPFYVKVAGGRYLPIALVIFHGQAEQERLHPTCLNQNLN